MALDLVTRFGGEGHHLDICTTSIIASNKIRRGGNSGLILGLERWEAHKECQHHSHEEVTSTMKRTSIEDLGQSFSLAMLYGRT